MSSLGIWPVLMWLGSMPGPVGEPPSRARIALLCVSLPGETPALTRRQIEAITAEQVAARPQLELARSEENFSLGMDDPLRVCGSDADCLAKAVRGLRAQIGLIVIVDASSGRPRLSLRSFESDTGAEIASAAGELESVERLRAQLGPRLGALFDEMGYPVAAALEVRTAPADAKLSLYPPHAKVRADQRHFLLAPGSYALVAELEDHEPKRLELVLEPGQTQLVELELERTQTLLGSAWFWIAIGGAIAVAATTVAVAVGTRDELWCFSGANRTCHD